MPRAVPAPSRPPIRFGAGLARHFVTIDPLMPSDWWAFAFVFLILGGALGGISGAGPGSIVLYIAVVGTMTALFPSLVVRSAARNWLLIAYPAWACLSAAWSIDPARTGHEAALIGITTLATLGLGGIIKGREINFGAAAVLFAFMILSVAHGLHAGASDGTVDNPMTGFQPQKNFFGHLAAMSAILSFSFFAFARTRFARILMLAGVLDLGLSTYALLSSFAVGSLLSLGTSLAVLVLVLVFKRVHWGIRVLALAAVAGVAIVFLTFGSQIEQIVGDAILNKFNKDTTLTGRTMLWDYADRLIGDRPMLGYGFGAFWTLDNPDAWVAWRMAGIRPGDSFNFHNTFRETMIAGGRVGLLIYVATYGAMAVLTVLRGLAAADLPSAVRIAFICYFVVRMPVEATGFGPVTFEGTLLFAFLCVPVRPGARARVAAPAAPRRERAAIVT